MPGGYEYTIYFAWVPEDTPWDETLARFDENIFDLVIEHDEGQIPTATIEIQNPKIGFISPTRLYWAWISYSYEACPPQPLMFGRLIGIPEKLGHNTVLMKFIARDTDYVFQKQQVARSLKVLPNYDKIFFEVSKRDDPDAILEGWSALYHVDRVDGRVSASDILVGEDGTISFAEQDVFHDNFEYTILQTPLRAINVKADVQWEQQFRGGFFVGGWAWPTLGGDKFIGDWPKSGSALGGGWFVGISTAGQRDPSIEEEEELTRKPTRIAYAYEWHSTAKKHRTGDTLTITENRTPTFGTSIVLREENIIGILDPFAVDENGDPAPINIPAHQSQDSFCYKTFALNFLGRQSVAALSLVYQADRKRFEKLEMTVEADVQPVLIDPDIVEDTEQITLKSGDLSLPLIDMLNWDSVGMGGAVEVGQFIFPDNPRVPGQTSSQICVQAGNTGMEIPTFSNIAGQTTADGTVIWASLGDTQPVEGSQDWARSARIPLGTLLLPKPISGVPDMESVRYAGNLNYPPTGVPIAVYTILCTAQSGPGDLMHECVVGGLVGGFGPQATFHNFINPSGMYLYIAVQAGVAGGFHTTFNETEGSQTGDGSVIWQNIGRVELPIGGWPGQTPAYSYFPTDRGQQSVQHMFCRARAKLRKRSRAVQISFDTRFEVAAQLSCRMNGIVRDERLPGGSAFGKIISYRIEAHGGANGDLGVLKGRVVLGCSTGKVSLPGLSPSVAGGEPAPVIVTDPGDPSYVKEGYVKRGYQKYYSSVSGSTKPPDQAVEFPGPANPPGWPTLPSTLPPETCPPLNSYWTAGPLEPLGNEMTYTPPITIPNDDGIVFGHGKGGLIMNSGWHGIASTMNPNNIAIYNLLLDAIIRNTLAAADANKVVPLGGVGGQATASITVLDLPQITNAVQIAVHKAMMQGENLWYELVLRPLNNGPFTNYYVVETSNLIVPQSIDLSAPSQF